MNHRESPHRSARQREALGCLAALLLASAGSAALPRPKSAQAHAPGMANSTDYLPVVGAPQLRFQAKKPAADPIATASVSATMSDSKVSSLQHDFILPKLLGTADTMVEPPSVSLPEKIVATPPTPVAKPPPAIIQDDLRPTARAEDFLPYFQMPGSARNPGDVTLITPVPRGAPAPAAIPPSSATYTQTPK